MAERGIMKKLAFILLTAVAAVLALSFSASAESLPEKYDSRELYKNPEVRSQRNSSLCWAFSAIGSVESYLAKKGITDENGELYDFSELYVNYATLAEYADRKGSYYGSILYSPGYDYYSPTYLLSGQPLIAESELPYDEGVEKVYYNDLFRPSTDLVVTGIKLNRAYTESLTLDNYSEWVRDCKESIMDYGSATIVLHMLASQGYGMQTYYYAQRPEYLESTHVLVIVGWDDTIPASMFMNEYGELPSVDGAWIARNEWGELAGDDGYYYLSYGNTAHRLGSDTLSVTEVEKRDFDNVYLSAPFCPNRRLFDKESESINGASVFTKTANDQSLKSVMLSVEEGGDYEIFFVSDYKSVSDLSRGVSVAKGTAEYSGFITVDFEPQKIVGDRFAVIVSYTGENRVLRVMDTEYANAPFEEGVSYVCNDSGDWQDLAAREGKPCVFFLRAFTEDNATAATLTFESEPYYAIPTVSRDGVEVARQPDGSFLLELGVYDYALTCRGVTRTGQIVVDGTKNNIKISRSFNFKAKARAVKTSYSAADPDEVFALTLTEGTGRFKDCSIVSAAVGGKKVKYTLDGDRIEIPSSAFADYKAGEKATVEITLGSGAIASVSVPIRKSNIYSNLQKLYAEAYEALDALTVDCYTNEAVVTEIVTRLAEKYKGLTVTVETPIYTEPSAYEGGSLKCYCLFSVEAQPEFHKRLVYLRQLPMIPPIPYIEDGAVQGWDEITEYAKKLPEGSGMTISADGVDTIPAAFLKSVKGRDIAVVLYYYGTGLSFNGLDVKEAVDTDTSFIFTSETLPNYEIPDSVYYHFDTAEAFRISELPFSGELINHICYDDGTRSAVLAEIYSFDGENRRFVFERDTIVSVSEPLRLPFDGSEVVYVVVFPCLYFLDADGNYVVNADDLKLLRDYLDGVIHFSDYQKLCLDIDLNGVIDENDYALIKKYIEE